MVDRTDSSTDNIITTTEPFAHGAVIQAGEPPLAVDRGGHRCGRALGVACGLVFWGFNFAYAWLSPLIGGILRGWPAYCTRCGTSPAPWP